METCATTGVEADAFSAEPRLERIVRADTCLMQLLRVARAADLPQWRVVAGCLYQTVWDSLTGRPRGTGINDYDVIYFDGADLSEESESKAENRIRAGLPSFPGPIEARNQARVHLWFEDYFGIPYSALSSKSELAARVWRHVQHYANAKGSVIEGILARAYQ